MSADNGVRVAENMTRDVVPLAVGGGAG